jgi:hypothetical protein
VSHHPLEQDPNLNPKSKTPNPKPGCGFFCEKTVKQNTRAHKHSSQILAPQQQGWALRNGLRKTNQKIKTKTKKKRVVQSKLEEDIKIQKQ